MTSQSWYLGPVDEYLSKIVEKRKMKNEKQMIKIKSRVMD